MKNIFDQIFRFSCIAGVIFLCSSCQPYEEMPPRTDNAVQYGIPDPVYPEKDEIAALKAIRAEHEDVLAVNK